jgi:plastocyanin
MPNARVLLPATAVVALLIAGCGSSSSSSSAPSGGGAYGGATPSTKTTAAPAATAAGGPSVALQNISFSPNKITVKVGQTITWTNKDSVDHNVTATSGATFKSSDFGQGGTFTYKPTKAGTIQYVCTIHQGMDGTIVVTG